MKRATPPAGYATRSWLLSEVGISERQLRRWLAAGLFHGMEPGRHGPVAELYSPRFVARARVIHQWLQYYPRGPLANLRDALYPGEDGPISAPLDTPDHTELAHPWSPDGHDPD